MLACICICLCLCETHLNFMHTNRRTHARTHACKLTRAYVFTTHIHHTTSMHSMWILFFFSSFCHLIVVLRWLRELPRDARKKGNFHFGVKITLTHKRIRIHPYYALYAYTPYILINLCMESGKRLWCNYIDTHLYIACSNWLHLSLLSLPLSLTLLSFLQFGIAFLFHSCKRTRAAAAAVAAARPSLAR